MQVQLRKHGNAKKFGAKVLATGHEVGGPVLCGGYLLKCMVTFKLLALELNKLIISIVVPKHSPNHPGLSSSCSLVFLAAVINGCRQIGKQWVNVRWAISIWPVTPLIDSCFISTSIFLCCKVLLIKDHAECNVKSIPLG